MPTGFGKLLTSTERGDVNLRLCDCSLFPEMIAGNIKAPTMAMAARAADLILEDARA